MPQLFLGRGGFRAKAEHNTANAALNGSAGLPGKRDSVYTPTEFYQIIFYLAVHPLQSLQGMVYVDGTFQFLRSVSLGGTSGNATLAVGGDLIINENLTVTNRHDLTIPTGRTTPGIVVLGFGTPVGHPTFVCGGQHVNGSGRFVVCERSKLVVDGLVYTQDGMTIESQASVDQIGAMYHNNRGTPNPSFTNANGIVVLRFDPLALSAFETGMTTISWQQLH